VGKSGWRSRESLSWTGDVFEISRGLISWSSGEWFGVEGRKGALVLIDKSSVCWQTSA
jgi:hypothetical protein